MHLKADEKQTFSYLLKKPTIRMIQKTQIRRITIDGMRPVRSRTLREYLDASPGIIQDNGNNKPVNIRKDTSEHLEEDM